LSEGGGSMRNAYGNAAAPLNGYIWDAVARKNLSVRSYGEFTDFAGGSPEARRAGKVRSVANVPGLEGRISPDYPSWDLTIPDARRFEAWQKEFSAQDTTDQVPAFSIIRMGNDHTNGTRPGTPTPRAMVAENDLAIGRLVETVSKSRVWKESAIFIVEDDAQNGPDHVDAHRSLAIVVSPFSRRRVVDSTMYTTSGILRTMELILGVPPMSQYDAAATPAYNAFQSTPTLTPFAHLEPRIPIDEKNNERSWGAAASLRMNLAEPDLAPDRELNEILWRSIKGPNSPMPPAVRSGFIRKAADADDPDERY
jgi:hypothetical protein